MSVPEGFDPASGRVDGFAWAAEQWETDSVAQDAALDAALAFEPVGTAAERIMAARAGRPEPAVEQVQRLREEGRDLPYRHQVAA